MNYAYKERIGKPELFTGRKMELDYFLRWIDDIKDEKSQSTAVMARRKMGKTALLERLFNITFYKNDGVIPFYYEIKENDVWIVDFCVDFCLTFVYQYVAFKTRKTRYLRIFEKGNLDKAMQVVRDEGLDYLVELLSGVKYAVTHDHVDILWETVRDAPRTVAHSENEFIVQMIDEFQFLNAVVYRDKKCENPAKTIAGGYLSTAESKIAPLLVSGSWVGWLMNLMRTMLPSRFNYEFLENMPEDEAVEMVYKYARFFEVPITEETAYLMSKLSEGSPFYIRSIIRSRFREKDLTTVPGLIDTLEFETLDPRGNIKTTWMEYFASAFKKVNGKNAKRIVLYLCRNRDREITRAELLEELALDIDDAELEEKLEALVKGDIISQGRTNFEYRAVTDNIFDKVFRGIYQKEIEQFDIGDIRKEYSGAFKELQQRYNRLQGKYNYRMGYFAEYLILDRLRGLPVKNGKLLKAVTRYLPEDFDFCPYSRVWKYDGSPGFSGRVSVDIFARAHSPGDYSIIGEVKSRQVKKFSIEEARDFERKLARVKELESIGRAVGFVFSRCGFTGEAEAFCKEKGIACSDDARWLES